jgi:hypothetical protein
LSALALAAWNFAGPPSVARAALQKPSFAEAMEGILRAGWRAKSGVWSLKLGIFLFCARSMAASLVYSNDFNGAPGMSYPEWSSSVIRYESRGDPPGRGTLPAPSVTNTVSRNGAQRFLGEFGGPPIGRLGDPGWNKTRVDQTISLSLSNLPDHTALRLTFDLYILKSWDGDSPAYGPDRFILGVADGPMLLDTTFSNNPKIGTDGSFQSYPAAKSPPWTGALSTNTLGYNRFFYDSIYRLQYTFPHSTNRVTFNFRSSLFEGKGTADESWGLDNVGVVALEKTEM